MTRVYRIEVAPAPPLRAAWRELGGALAILALALIARAFVGRF